MRRMESLSLTVALVLFAGMAIPGIAKADKEIPQSNARRRVTPSAVWCGESDSMVTIEVHILGRDDVAEVQVTNSRENDRFTLYDDGTHGDAHGTSPDNP